MAEPGRAGGRATPWPGIPARARRIVHAPWWLSDFLGPLAARWRAWIAAEAGAGRLVPWLPVAFGAGIALYFTAQREPAIWAALIALIACASATALLRRRSLGFALAALAAAAAAGFAIATFKSVRIEHPVLTRPLFGVEGAGGTRAHRPHRARGASNGRTAAGGAARTRASVGAQGHCAAGRQLRGNEGAAEPAAQPTAAGGLRFRARPLFSADRRQRIR